MGTVDRSVAIMDPKLYVFDIDKSLTFFTYQLAAASGISVGGRWLWGRRWTDIDFEVLGPSSRDLGGDLREIYFEE